MGREMLKNTKHVLLCPWGPPPQAAGDQLVISRWKVPFLTVYSAKNFGSWLHFSSESQDNRESCSMQENSPIILPERKQVSSRTQFNKNPTQLATAKSQSATSIQASKIH